MNKDIWPFLVGCNKTLGYHVIVSPPFLSGHARSHLLFQATGGNETTDKTAIAREIHGGNFGTITVIFRVVKARAKEYDIEGDDVLKDRVGRDIRLFEGVVFKARIEDIEKAGGVTEKDFEIAHGKVKSAYKAFWAFNEGFSEQISQSFPFHTPVSAADQEVKVVHLRVEAPLEVPGYLATEGPDIPVTRVPDRLGPVVPKKEVTSTAHTQKKQDKPVLPQMRTYLAKPISPISLRNLSLPSLLQRKRLSTRSRIFIAISVIAIFVILFAFAVQIINYYLFRPTATISKDGIGVTSVNGENIGISDGRYALDTNRPAGPLMMEASDSLRKGNVGNALAEWSEAHEKETNDAEPLIYIENQRVLASGSPYITVVLGVSLGVQVPDGFSPDRLQAAYIVQRECNDNPQLSGGKKLRLLIARSGSDPNNSQVIARQIVQAAQFDKTIVGVQGWTTSLTTLNVVTILASAHLPIVAPDTASDVLTGISPYFFRVGTSNKVDAPLKITYIENKLAPQNSVIFKDHTDPYSSSSVANFAQQFANDGYHIASIEDFKIAEDAQDGKLAQHVRDVLTKYKPDFLFLGTTAVSDVTTVLNTIPATPQYAGLKVFTGAAGYELVQSGEKINGYAHMLISSSAFPDEWSILAGENQKPSFFDDYAAAYDPHNQHLDFPYTYRRANGEVMMDYDALYAFLVASRIAIQQGKHDPTSEDIRNALSQINGSQSFQGVTGAISFDSQGDPINKLRFILRVADDGQHLHVAAYQGCFLVNSACNDDIRILE